MKGYALFLHAAVDIARPAVLRKFRGTLWVSFVISTAKRIATAARTLDSRAKNLLPLTDIGLKSENHGGLSP
jgi:hypothetical protein